jgi:hypothetical protein
MLLPASRALLAAYIVFDIGSTLAAPSEHNAVPQGSKTGKFLWLSDFHYDKFYGTNSASNFNSGCNSSINAYYGQANCDSPWSLIEASMQVCQSTWSGGLSPTRAFSDTSVLRLQTS